MKITRYITMALAALALASCSEDFTESWQNDPEAVRLNVSVGTATRSNPLGTAEEQQMFNANDKISLSNGTATLNYVFDGTSWSPENDEYLRWENADTHFEAYYPVVPGASFSSWTVPSDQTTLDAIKNADYMKCSVDVSGNLHSHQPLNLVMTRQTARINVEVTEIAKVVGNNPQLTGLEFFDAADHSVKAYKFDGKNIFTALIDPNTVKPDKFFDVIMKTDEAPEVRRTAMKWHQGIVAGKNYNIKVKVGDDVIKIQSVDVTDWTQGGTFSGDMIYAMPQRNEIWVKTKSGNYPWIDKYSYNNLIKPTPEEQSTRNELGYFVLKFKNNGTPTELGSCFFFHSLEDAGTDITEVIIPEGFTSIGSRCFEKCEDLKSVHLPSTITTIQNGAFCRTSSLRDVNLPAGLTTLEYEAFSNSGIKEVTIPEAITNVDSLMFYNCPNLEKVTMTKVKSITGKAFSKCPSLKTMVLPEGLTQIGHQAFYNSGVENITFPATTEKLFDEAFSACPSLTTIDMSKLTGIRHIGLNMFAGCKLLNNIKLYPNITSLTTGMFKGCSGIKNFPFPSSLTTIGQDALSGIGVENLDLSTTSVTTLGENAFASCPSLVTLKLSSKLQNIGSYAFNGCNNLTTVNFNGATVTGSSEFSGCTSLKNVTLGNISSLSVRMFSGCSGLETITLPAAVTELPEDVFYSCTSLSSMDMPNITTIDGGAFQSCTSLTRVNAPKVTTILSSAFRDCTRLSSLTLPAKAVEIRNFAFQGCTSLTSFTIPEGCKIGFYAFKNTGLKNINISENVRFDAYSIFMNTADLTTVDFPASCSFASSWGNSSSMFAGSGASKIIFRTSDASKCSGQSTSFFGNMPNLTELQFLGPVCPLRTSENWFANDSDSDIKTATNTANIKLTLHPDLYKNAKGNTWNGYTFKEIVEYNPTQK